VFTESVPAAQVIIPLLPEIGLVILLLLVLVLDLFFRPVQRRVIGLAAGTGMAAVMLINVVVGLANVGTGAFREPVLGGMIRYDMLALLFRTMVLLAGALVCVISVDTPKIGRQGEFFAILIVATLGLSLMSAAADLIMVFLSVETASISLYVLAGFLRETDSSAEAGLKYYLFGAASAGIFLYGLSLLFGFAGTTNIYQMAGPLGDLFRGSAQDAFGLLLALLLVLVGFGFKIAAVPFHFWSPDVYEGAPTPVTAFISTASKAASFALLVRVFSAVWPVEAAPYWTGLLAAVAVVTITLGNLVALVQRNIKRLIAYSSIAQAGYALVGVVALTETQLGVAAVAFYMFMYVLTNILAFTVIIAVGNTTGSDQIADFAGLSRRKPYLALAMVLAFLSLGGVPPLAGFFGKFFLFAAAVRAGYVWLAIVGVLNSIVALYYYLTVIKVMYVDPTEDTRPIIVTPGFAAVLVIASAGVLLMGTVAGPWWNWALSAAQSLAALP
jgi:NADH-quinone oxidoreductase subunit N